MSLADKIIEQNTSSVGEYSEWGIDELGLPIPKPLNSSYIAARIITKSEFYYKVGDSVFINHELVKKSLSSLSLSLSILCGEPRIIMWKNEGDKENWKGVSSLIKRESAMIYAKLLEVAPTFDKKVIKVADNLYWDKEKGDFI